MADRNASTTLLLVDDSTADRLAARRYLTSNSQRNLEEAPASGVETTYEILEVAAGEEGLALLEQQPVDLILLDYRLPDLDGLEFLDRLKALFETPPPVVMFTGQGDERIAAQAIKAGAHDYIVKQSQMAEVMRIAVRTALKESQLRKRLAAYQSQQSLIQDIALRIRQSLSLEEILTRAVQEVHALLECDRTVIYRFLPDGVGLIEVEAVRSPWSSIKGEIVKDSCFKNGWLGQYLTGKTTAIENIHESGLTPCYVDLLTRYQVQANLVVPIVLSFASRESQSAFAIQPATGGEADTAASDSNSQDKILWGLLIAHQCEAPRIWNELELDLLKQLSGQMAIAVQQAQLYEELQAANQSLEAQVQTRTQELQAANTALKTSNQDLEQFAYIASHDLREPLRKVKSFADLLSRRYRDQLDETGDRYIDYITDGAIRMQQLIGDLLTYSRLGKTELEKVPTDLTQIVNQALETLSEQIEQKQAVVKVGPLPILPVGTLQLEQLVRNLIENGLKYNNSSSPSIAIAAQQRPTDWLISVQDNGIGIDPQFYDRIFTIFQRLHSKSEYSGTGIGLAVCKKIVERHGGTIGVISGEDEGTTFWFTLPVQ